LFLYAANNVKKLSLVAVCVLPICQFQKLYCLTIIQKQKGFISELSLNNAKIFRTKFRRLVKTPLSIMKINSKKNQHRGSVNSTNWDYTG